MPENIPLALLDHTLIEQAVASSSQMRSHAPSNLPIEIDAEYKGTSCYLSRRPRAGPQPEMAGGSLKILSR